MIQVFLKAWQFSLRLDSDHTWAMQDRLNAQLKGNEDDYREKLLGLKAKMEARDVQIEAELQEMASDFKQELAKALRLADTENVSPNNKQDDDDFLISESTERRPLAQQPPQPKPFASQHQTQHTVGLD